MLQKGSNLMLGLSFCSRAQFRPLFLGFPVVSNGHVPIADIFFGGGFYIEKEPCLNFFVLLKDMLKRRWFDSVYRFYLNSKQSPSRNCLLVIFASHQIDLCYALFGNIFFFRGRLPTASLIVLLFVYSVIKKDCLLGLLAWKGRR